MKGWKETYTNIVSPVQEEAEEEIVNERIKVAGKSKHLGKTFNQKTEVNNIKKIINAVNKLAKDMDKWQYPGSIYGPSKIYDALTQVESECYDHMIDVEDGKYDGEIAVED